LLAAKKNEQEKLKKQQKKIETLKKQIKTSKDQIEIKNKTKGKMSHSHEENEKGAKFAEVNICYSF
jgi:predicted phage tail protein